METDGSSALAIYDKPATLMPAVPTEGEIRSLAMIADYAARSNFLRSTAPKSDQQQRQADAFFVIMYGRELGIPPMTALKMMYVLDGQPSAATQTIVALARRRGVEVDIPDPMTVTDSATVRVKRPGGDWKAYTFTLEMARKMGLTGKQNWQKQQPVMLIWRAAGMAMRMEVSDYTGGLYPLEELSPDTPVNEDGEPVGEIIISKPEPVTAPALPPVAEVAPEPEPVTPKMASCLKTDPDCQKRFKSLCDELGIVSDKPYIKALGLKERYSEYPGTFDELVQKMRDLHEAFNTPDPVAEASAAIPVDQAAATLGSGGNRRITANPTLPDDVMTPEEYERAQRELAAMEE